MLLDDGLLSCLASATWPRNPHRLIVIVLIIVIVVLSQKQIDAILKRYLEYKQNSTSLKT